MTEAIIKMIADAYAFQKTEMVQRFRHTYPLHEFIESFQTVRIALPRRCGHTSAALALYKKYPNTVMIFPTQHLREHFMNMGEFSGISKADFLTYRSVVLSFPYYNRRELIYTFTNHAMTQRGRQLPPPMFILDPASVVGIGTKKDIIPSIAHRWSKIKMYIELG